MTFRLTLIESFFSSHSRVIPIRIKGAFRRVSGGRTGKRFVGFDPFFVGLTVKSSKFVGLSVKRKLCGVGD